MNQIVDATSADVDVQRCLTPEQQAAKALFGDEDHVTPFRDEVVYCLNGEIVSFNQVVERFRVAEIPAMYAGAAVDPGPAGFGDTFVIDGSQIDWSDIVAPNGPALPCRREGGTCDCSGLGPCEATMPKSWCEPDSIDLTRFKLVYLGSPYTKYAGGIEQAFRDVSAIAAEMLREGVRVYSPIAHTHPIAVHGNLDPLNHEIWLPFDQAMMDAAEAMVIADMDGWRESYGVKYEIDYFRAAGKPVYFRSADGTVDKLR